MTHRVDMSRLRTGERMAIYPLSNLGVTMSIGPNKLTPENRLKSNRDRYLLQNPYMDPKRDNTDNSFHRQDADDHKGQHITPYFFMPKFGTIRPTIEDR